MPVAMLGVVWPDLRGELDRPTGALGWLVTAYGAGRLITSSWGAMAVRRFGMARSMMAGSLVLVAAVGSVALSGAWIPLLVALAVVGLVTGLLDSLGNRFIALSGSVAHAGMVAGTYGIGATAGPAIATAFDGWRVPFVVAGVVTAAAAGLVLSVGARWDSEAIAPRPRPPRPDVPRTDVPRTDVPRTDVPRMDVRPADLPGAAPRAGRTALPRLGFAVSLVVFFAFVSIEVATGAWLATYLEDHRGLSGSRAGIAVTMFWAGITVGRLGMGVLAKRVRIAAVLPLVPVLVVGGFVLTAVAPTAVVVVVLTLLGLALAPVMPTLMASTASRVGVAQVGRVTGLQLVAANVGAISVPAAIGVLVDHVGPSVTPVVLGALAVLGAAPLVWASRRIAAPGVTSD